MIQKTKLKDKPNRVRIPVNYASIHKNKHPVCEIVRQLSDIATDINRHHEQGTVHAMQAIEHAKIIGDLLIQAKLQVGHGGWLNWLSEHCDVSSRQAQRYIRVASKWTDIKYDAASHLTIDQTLDLFKTERQPDDCEESYKWANKIPKDVFLIAAERMDKLIEEIAQWAKTNAEFIQSVDSIDATLAQFTDIQEANDLLNKWTAVERPLAQIILRLKAEFGGLFEFAEQ